MARYEEERYGGQRGSARRGGYSERGRDDDIDQQERDRQAWDRYRSSESGREYESERGRGGYEESWRGQRDQDYGRSLGGRESSEGYEDENTYGSSYNAGGREGNRYGSQYRQGDRNQGRWGSQRYGQGMRDFNPSQGFGWSPENQGSQAYRGSQGYQGSTGYGQGSYGQSSYEQSSYQRAYNQGGRGNQGQQHGQGGRGSSQADGWSSEPDEMRWGRQQGLYGSSEYGGYMSSVRSQSDYQSHAGKGPKGWQRSDERIREEVNETLARHPEIDASEVEVRVQNGEVTLTGTVDDRRTKRLAEDIVENVFGVNDVENKIKVKGGGLFGFGKDKDKDVTSKAERERETTESRRTTAGSTTGTTGTTR